MYIILLLSRNNLLDRFSGTKSAETEDVVPVKVLKLTPVKVLKLKRV
jgi:hypothetical protein